MLNEPTIRMPRIITGSRPRMNWIKDNHPASQNRTKVRTAIEERRSGTERTVSQPALGQTANNAAPSSSIAGSVTCGLITCTKKASRLWLLRKSALPPPLLPDVLRGLMAFGACLVRGGRARRPPLHPLGARVRSRTLGPGRPARRDRGTHGVKF